ncbi:DUF397 domain-containing protein [Actinomadura spongiicola]|uniref:DUF397 domain-containing protein n=1 Tax=Actinomadura spongiicola TaxID=2303421 RepID=A0A372GHQ6_9ACTN|nr:DUF397 domain-containing protein [Actinomadura spongiicola]RFS84891.1 DUF397 domain-containing protein [Actinomadura spongiicola]
METIYIIWRTSSHSTGNGGECVEIGSWHKSSHSAKEGECVEVGPWRKSSWSGEQGNCLEVVADEAVVLARDSKNPDGPILGFGTEAWSAFLTTVKRGQLDLP